MTHEQFNALAKLMRLQECPSKQAARMVLVDGTSSAAAARETGLTSGGVAHVIRRCNDAMALAKVVSCTRCKA
jgi:hypothetical protein